jgi:ComF family protein
MQALEGHGVTATEPPASPAPFEDRRPSVWRRAARTVQDLVFPPVCLHCGGLCEGSRFQHVCRQCDPLILRVAPPHCYTCGHPYFGVVEGERMCPHCEGVQAAYREARTLTLLKGPARDLILALKYRGAEYVLGDIETLMRENRSVCEFITGAVLVPVPLHPRKERERGFNQSLRLAQAFVRAVDGRAEVRQLLRRVEDTQTQTIYDRKARRERMKNAFAPDSRAAITAQHHYVLVDDVFTTGSTLNACARELRRAGGLNLDVLTFGHG